MTKNREHKVEKYLREQIESIGGITRKWVSPGRSGVPDQIIFIKGLILFAEVKTVDGKLSSPQEREIKRLQSHGAWIEVLHGHVAVDELISWLERRLNK